jgi:putative membrane protein
MSLGKIWRGIAACAGLMLIVSAATAQNQTPNRSKPAPAPMRDEDTTFINKAIEMNYAEVELGRLAVSKAQNMRVKSYADMLVKDHSAALPKFQALDPVKPSSKPELSDEHKELKTRLSWLSGMEFDREYMDAMVSAHREAVSMFERQAGAKKNGAASAPPATGSNAAVTKLASATLPMLKRHLEQAEQIQKGLMQTPSSTKPPVTKPPVK